MVETRLATIVEKDEYQQIMKLIRNEENFLLSGGAGSGKTYTLVQVIRKVIAEYPTTNVACMTYTNAAVKQIEERVNHENLKVTTIHDFLWDIIKNYQTELKKVLIELINDDDIEISPPTPEGGAVNVNTILSNTLSSPNKTSLFVIRSTRKPSFSSHCVRSASLAIFSGNWCINPSISIIKFDL